MDRVDQILVSGVAFGKNSLGLILRPYETYRRIVDRGSVVELLPIGLLLAGYFALASLVKEDTLRPFLLTRQFMVLVGTAGVSFFLVSATLWTVGTIVGGKGTFSRFVLAWGYTMLPTIAWFLMTSILYLILPPPRTTRTLGVAFSMLYLVISATILFWKILLGYLSLRFGLRLDLGKIVVVAIVAAPIFALYSFAMYKLGVFKVPFL
ncbi:YIP1 family protein [Candidatus Gottesmanbacteria bacterium]|nr:YIP1 family protein [Candidatus Gottesmanbacteria bacterium]